jgi:hypothetical protein
VWTNSGFGPFERRRRKSATEENATGPPSPCSTAAWMSRSRISPSASVRTATMAPPVEPNLRLPSGEPAHGFCLLAGTFLLLGLVRDWSRSLKSGFEAVLLGPLPPPGSPAALRAHVMTSRRFSSRFEAAPGRVGHSPPRRRTASRLEASAKNHDRGPEMPDVRTRAMDPARRSLDATGPRWRPPGDRVLLHEVRVHALASPR